jgi:8-oxo-dGTP diphosphatase
MTKYVVGFMFNPQMSMVAMIRKKRPKWQNGLMNGIGGKVEPGESVEDTMIREFSEETGYDTHEKWRVFCAASGVNNDKSTMVIDFFYTFGPLHKLVSMTDEEIVIVNVTEIFQEPKKFIGNIPWLIALCLDYGKGIYPPIFVQVSY